jgi:glycosyltransferase involved in cell wall biosynthesis
MAEKKSAPTLSIVIPAYNEAGRIEKHINEIRQTAAADFPALDIVIVNDGSADQTPEITGALGRRFPNIKVIHLPQNRGKGYAVKQGTEASRGKYILITDADGSAPFSELASLFPYRASNDIIIGSRYLDGSTIGQPQSFIRQVIGWFASHIIARFLLPGIKDSRCGFKLLSRAAATRLCEKQTINGFSFDTEWLLIGRHAGLKIKEVPINWSDSGMSSVRPFRDIVQALADIARMLWNKTWKRYDDADETRSKPVLSPYRIRNANSHGFKARNATTELQLERY